MLYSRTRQTVGLPLLKVACPNVESPVWQQRRFEQSYTTHQTYLRCSAQALGYRTGSANSDLINADVDQTD